MLYSAVSSRSVIIPIEAGKREVSFGRQSARPQHSPSLMALGLSLGYETWPPVSWHYPFVIGWSKHRFVSYRSALCAHVTDRDFHRFPLTVPLHSPDDRYLPAAWDVQGDCRRV